MQGMVKEKMRHGVGVDVNVWHVEYKFTWENHEVPIKKKC